MERKQFDFAQATQENNEFKQQPQMEGHDPSAPIRDQPNSVKKNQQLSKSSTAYLENLERTIRSYTHKMGAMKKRKEDITSLYLQSINQCSLESAPERRQALFEKFNSESEKLSKKINSISRSLSKFEREKQQIEKTGRISNTRQFLDGITNFFDTKKYKNNADSESLKSVNNVPSDSDINSNLIVSNDQIEPLIPNDDPNELKFQNSSKSIDPQDLNYAENETSNKQLLDSKNSMISSKSGSVGELIRYLTLKFPTNVVETDGSRSKRDSLDLGSLKAQNSLGSQSDSSSVKRSEPCVTQTTPPCNESISTTFHMLANLLIKNNERIQNAENKISLIDSKSDEIVETVSKKIEKQLEPTESSIADHQYLISELRVSLESLDYRISKLEQNIQNRSKSDKSEESQIQSLAMKLANILVQIITVVIMLFSSFIDALIELNSKLKVLIMFILSMVLFIQSTRPFFAYIFR